MTSLYTNWAENHKETGHFQQKYWKSCKIAHFVTLLWRHWECHEIFNTHSYKFRHFTLWNRKKQKDTVKSKKGAVLL